jgi:cytochrome b involved in lipid metabolism
MTLETGFIDDHPGGIDILRMHAGEDASKEFDDVGHSNTALKQLQSLLVGRLST